MDSFIIIFIVVINFPFPPAFPLSGKGETVKFRCGGEFGEEQILSWKQLRYAKHKY